MPGTLSANISTGVLVSSVGRVVVCSTDGTVVLVELDQDGYVVCHCPLSYGVFDTEGVNVELNMEVPVDGAKFAAYEVEEDGALLLLEIIGSEDELIVEVLTDMFEYCIEDIEGMGTLALVAAELVGDKAVLDAPLREVVPSVVGTALFEEDFDAKGVDGLELDSVVTGSETSTVTVGGLTSMIE
jgi:hypothetical protein